MDRAGRLSEILAVGYIKMLSIFKIPSALDGFMYYLKILYRIIEKIFTSGDTRYTY